jgi:hypothetical protein
LTSTVSLLPFYLFWSAIIGGALLVMWWARRRRRQWVGALASRRATNGSDGSAVGEHMVKGKAARHKAAPEK